MASQVSSQGWRLRFNFSYGRHGRMIRSKQTGWSLTGTLATCTVVGQGRSTCIGDRAIRFGTSTLQAGSLQWLTTRPPLRTQSETVLAMLGPGRSTVKTAATINEVSAPRKRLSMLPAVQQYNVGLSIFYCPRYPVSSFVCYELIYVFDLNRGRSSRMKTDLDLRTIVSSNNLQHHEF